MLGFWDITKGFAKDNGNYYLMGSVRDTLAPEAATKLYICEVTADFSIVCGFLFKIKLHYFSSDRCCICATTPGVFDDYGYNYLRFKIKNPTSMARKLWIRLMLFWRGPTVLPRSLTYKPFYKFRLNVPANSEGYAKVRYWILFYGTCNYYIALQDRITGKYIETLMKLDMPVPDPLLMFPESYCFTSHDDIRVKVITDISMHDLHRSFMEFGLYPSRKPEGLQVLAKRPANQSKQEKVKIDLSRILPISFASVSRPASRFNDLCIKASELQNGTYRIVGDITRRATRRGKRRRRIEPAHGIIGAKHVKVIKFDYFLPDQIPTKQAK